MTAPHTTLRRSGVWTPLDDDLLSQAAPQLHGPTAHEIDDFVNCQQAQYKGNLKKANQSPPASQQQEITTLVYAAEIELALVSTIWHYPGFLAQARQELDFAAHISIAAHRYVIEAVGIVFGKFGEADWTCVLQAIREMDALDECGALQGLNDIFTDNGHYPEGRGAPEIFVPEFIRLLKEYCVARKADPFKPLRHFTRGHGFLQRNKLATKSTHPCSVGRIPRCCCGRPCVIAGWPASEEGTVNLTLELER